MPRWTLVQRDRLHQRHIRCLLRSRVCSCSSSSLTSPRHILTTACVSSRYYCTGGSATPRPLNSSEGGYACPQGYYCPMGSAVPLGCLPGTYNDQLARNVCLSCPAGRMCDLSNMTTPVDCKQGEYTSTRVLD